MNSSAKPLTIDNLNDFLSKSYDVDFDLKTFQRKFRKFYKFSIVSENLFSIKSKLTGNSLMIWVLDNNYFELRHTAHSHLFLFNCLSGSELIKKLIKHNIY